MSKDRGRKAVKKPKQPKKAYLMRVLTSEEFLKTDAGTHAVSELQRMLNSSVYSTQSSYDASADCPLAFIDRHINYLAKHPYVSPVVYITNLRVMTKLRG